MWGSFLLIWVFGILALLSLFAVAYGFATDNRASGWVGFIGIVLFLVFAGLFLAQTSRRQSMFTREQISQFLQQTWTQPYTIDTTYWDNSNVIFYSNGNQYIATLNDDNTVIVKENVVVATGKVK